MIKQHLTIAIDGPGGVGKSTVADAVARELNILHLDTGAMYRAFAYQALLEGIDPSDETELEKLVERTSIDVELKENGVQRTLVNQTDVSDLIRTPEISFAASTSSKFGAVRRYMVKKQQALAKTTSMVMDGRDIGTKVLTDATLKIFLTAAAQERAKRRYEQLLQKGQSADYQQVLADVIKRDHQDSAREIDPLRPAEDAVVIDSTHNTKEQTIQAVLKLVEDRR